MKGQRLVTVLALLLALALPAMAQAKAAAQKAGAKAAPAKQSAQAGQQTAPISEATQACLECHSYATPGIVADWERSRHSQISPAMALEADEAGRRISAEKVPAKYAHNAIGCAECHLRPDAVHPDNFQHDAYKVHVVVSPPDCAMCHPKEAEQYKQNLMSHAHGNLVKNHLYMDLATHVNGTQIVSKGNIRLTPPDAKTTAESCLYCHGTKIERTGWHTRTTDFGDFKLPVYKGWPNHGVGRINPDGSKGTCAACHSRHQFSIEMARSPAACAECHKGPDVPAYKIYQVSKHGNLYQAMSGQWDMSAVPWKTGADFTAPTCAACHVSLVTDGQGTVLAKRTHRMNDRLWLRILGLPYSHPHPKSPETWRIKNADGMTLATTLNGAPASGFLIDAKEQAARKARMTGICKACHSTDWVNGQMARMDQSVKDGDAAVKAATDMVMRAWKLGLAKGPAQKASPFDENIENMWVAQWLFYANSIRFASAMMGADYGVFEQGRWNATGTVRRMHDWLKIREKK